MVMEIIVGVIALAFATLVVFFIFTLQNARKTLKKTDKILSDIHKTLDAIAEPSAHLVSNVDKLAVDIKKKSEGLDILFHPLYAMNRKKGDGKQESKFSEIVGWVGEAIRLFQKIKNEIVK